ncbi:MAG: ABC transporter permease [Acetomicrobium sp.]|jgi:putative ABC transport system permease protein|uniref:ABC transporter permease n=1 Tax=Acetomicrobium TaxID=49894 RepID=UPI0026EB181E|nr:ABC transporter permease [Acetomicrobium mobile]MDI9376911.1 ABC transporter permease [Synergistota bacterium]HOB10898.1 ABC transporter permease [Acetomicrobium sp.]HQA36198.1 ABC transporter permease [Acetomicrobium sp.]HQC87606.1 ABC transporter permease [Acetomicrobium sp.]
MISFTETCRVSFRAIVSNKMRSGLAMLGIVIGVGAVIAMLALGAGATVQIKSVMSSMGSNLLVIRPGTVTSGGIRIGAGSVPSLTLDDAKAIKAECPSVEEVLAQFNGSAQIVYGNQNWSTQVAGVTVGVFVVNDWKLTSGRPFTDQDMRSATKVAILGSTVARELFGYSDPVGEIIRIKKIPFQVIGVLESKGESSWGRDQDDIVMVPVTTAQKRLFGMPRPNMVSSITVKVKSEDLMAVAQEEVTLLLRQRHKITSFQDDDFTVRNMAQAMEAAQQSTKVMSLLLGSIASVSLLVGGIGIMNVMLVSVTERTREIGIRMAVGATSKDIMLQFLVESGMLSMTGGFAGVLFGTILSRILSGAFEWQTVVLPGSIALAFGFSALVGIVFGLYPAYKASLLNPIEALRYE